MNQAANFGGQNLETSNQLWKYVSSLEPETMARLSQPATDEVLQVMERHVVAMLGQLPSDHFDVMITTSRENLGRLVASAMMNGYFLRAAEQRMSFEGMMQDSPASDGDHASSL
jgi:DNA-binding GntR family transcriptional regulator